MKLMLGDGKKEVKGKKNEMGNTGRGISWEVKGERNEVNVRGWKKRGEGEEK